MKFKVGDKLVFKSNKSYKFGVWDYTVTEVSEGYYRIKSKGATNTEGNRHPMTMVEDVLRLALMGMENE